MASAFSHAIVASATGSVIAGREKLKFWIISIACAILPDADAIGFKLGVPYDHPFGHRGFTHSIVFALVLALVVMTIFYRAEKIFSRKYLVLFTALFVATASHGVLDAFTNGGLGVEFFYPFDTSRYFFPW